MKKIKSRLFVALLFLLIGINSKAQTSISDSLMNVVFTAKEDSSKIDAINDMPFGFYEADSMIYYAQKILTIGLQQKDDLVTALGWVELSFGNWLIEDYDNAIEYSLKALKIAELHHNQVVLGSVYDMLAIDYEFIDPVKSLQYSKKAVSYINNEKPNIFDQIIYSNYSYFLINAKQPDSALVYAQKSYQSSLHFKRYEGDAFINADLAAIHLLLGDKDLALVYLKRVMATAAKFNSKRIYAAAYNDLANYFDFLNQKDSAVYYYKKVIDTREQFRFLSGTIIPAKKIYEYYKSIGNVDSALKYNELELMAVDSTMNIKKITQIQNMSFEEELREKDMAAQNLQLLQDRKYNLQLAILAVGILTLIILFLLLSRSFIVSHKLVEFLSVVVLLVVFEFINLLLHPFLRNVTNDSPALMLLGLVAIAALIVPFHHRLEKWTTKKLVEKNKAIRLANAKKIIEDLGQT
jgi:tetratricopeptide (TPR) repeat protein